MLHNYISLTHLCIGARQVHALKLTTLLNPPYPEYDPIINRAVFSETNFNVYPLKLFATEKDIVGITCNDIGYYIVIWSTGVAKLIINASDRDMLDDRVNKTVFAFGGDDEGDGFSKIEYGHCTTLDVDSHKRLLRFITAICDTLNDTLSTMVDSSSIDYDGLNFKNNEEQVRV